MNLNEAEIAVTTKRLVTVNPKKSYRMELADYCDIDEFHHACATRFPEEAEPEYRYTDWENIPEYMVSSEWLCPNFFEVREAMERLDEFQQDCFEQWCGHYGYNLATEDPHLLVSYFQDSPHARMVVREEEEPDVEEDNLVYQGISSYYSFVTSYPYEVLTTITTNTYDYEYDRTDIPDRPLRAEGVYRNHEHHPDVGQHHGGKQAADREKRPPALQVALRLFPVVVPQ